MGLENAIEHYDNTEITGRKARLFRPVNTHYDLCMAYFHRVDMHQYIDRVRRTVRLIACLRRGRPAGEGVAMGLVFVSRIQM